MSFCHKKDKDPFYSSMPAQFKGKIQPTKIHLVNMRKQCQKGVFCFKSPHYTPTIPIVVFFLQNIIDFAFLHRR